MKEKAQIRHTRQREAIYTALREAMRPLSFEELLERARRHYPKIGERTVFRNVRELLDEQALVRIYLPGQPARYELPTWSHRPHLVCRKSGKVFILPVEAPDLIPLMPPMEDFVLEGEEVFFYGYHKNPPED